MPADITWNGPAKSYRVGQYNFLLNRQHPTIDDDEMIEYLKLQKGFTVTELPKKVAPAPVAAAAPVAATATEPVDSDDAESGTKPSRGPRTRGSRGGK